MLKTIISVLLLFLVQPCFAGCEELAKSISGKLHPEMQLDEGLVSCKAIPNNENQTILVLPYSLKCNSDNPNDLDCNKRDVEILIVKSDDGSIISQLFQKRAWQDDTFQFNSSSIDTGHYQLNAQDRAFGVRVHRSQYHYGGEAENLSLYVAHGNSILPILNYLEMSATLQEAESDHDCGLGSTSLYRTLALSKTVNYGYVDLLLNESQSHKEVKWIQGKCKDYEKSTNNKYLLHFNGEQYVVPQNVTANDF